MNDSRTRERGVRIARRAEALADSWINGNRSHVVNEVLYAPEWEGTPLRAALASAVALELEERKSEPWTFAAALANRHEAPRRDS